MTTNRKQLTLAALLFSMAAAALPIVAQDSDSQAARIKALEEKVDQLDQAIKVADRKAEVKAEDDAAQQKLAAHVTADGTGFAFRSNDGNFIFRIGADLQVDSRTFYGSALTTLPDTFLLRRARPVFSATVYKYFDFYLRPDFGQGTTVIYDAYIGVNYFKHFKLRAGKFKPPVGLERLQEDDNTTFVERGLPTLLAPSRDIGFQLFGDIIDNRVSYQVGVFNGVPDNGLSDVGATDHRDFAGRLFFTPFQTAQNNPLGGLGFGIGATTGSVDGIALPGYKSFGQNTFVSFASGVTEAGHRDRLAPQLYYYLGPFGLLSEYTVSTEGLQKGTVRRDIAFRAWQVELSYILTGEKKGFGQLAPKRNFDPAHHAWGAVELAVRTGEFSAENGLYNYGFALPTASARLAKEWVGGVNWYLNRFVRTSVDYAVTNFEGGAPTGNRPTEKSLIARLQLNFQSFAQ